MKNLHIKLPSTFLFFMLLLSCGSNEPPAEDEIVEIVENTIETKKSEASGPFDIESGVIQYEFKKLDGTITSTNTFYFDDYGNVLKLEETVDGETSVYMYDENKGKGLTMFPGRDPSKISMRQGELNSLVAMQSTSGYTQQDNESIAGKDCIVYANNATSAEGESQHVYCKHKGLLLKEINRLSMGYIIEAVGMEEKSLDAGVFAKLEGLD